MDESFSSRKPPSGRSPKSRRKAETNRTCEEGSDSESDSGHTSRSHRSRRRRHHDETPCEGGCARTLRHRKHDLRSAASSPGSYARNHSSCSDRDLHDWSSCSASRDGEYVPGWYPDWRAHTPYGFLGPMGPAVPPYWYPKGDIGYPTAPAYWRPIYKPEVEERLRRLEGEKDSLQLQVSVLMEQIDAQSDKISEMEKVLQERSSQLSRTEELLQKELILRSQLETQKMELAKELSSLRLRSVSVEKENLLLRAGAQIDALESPEGKHMSPDRFGRVGSPDAASTPVSSKDLFQAQRSPNRGLGGSMDIMPNLERSPMMVKQPRTPPASTFRRVDLSQSMSGTLPRTNFSPDKGREGSRQPTPKRGVAFGKGFNFFRPADKRSCSAPNLAETERSEEGDDGGSEDLSPLSPETPSSLNLSPTGSAGKNKGIRKLFGRMRRSSSSAFEEPEGAFKRGGVRATAGPRLGWGAENRTTFVEPATPFGNWDMETVINWLNDLGLQGCAVEARRWVRRGQQLLDAAPSELEKELALKNPLHKKKLLLALEAKGRPINDMLRPFGSPLSNPAMDVAAGKLDHNWVVRWLDDVGLPQYKDLFMESRVDGRVLHNLTVDDLCSFLKVTNLLHLTSVKRGIQVLRNNNFSPDCLVRRPLPEEANQPITAAQVALWTNHRVMEWLRTVDLSEYAPNLRGSGVHGALMVYEPKFTAELLATILSIPAGKTLLRRHLTTHFKELVGKDVMQEKREVETEPGYTPITPLVKAKVVKRGQFTLKRRKSKSEFDSDELVCPLDTSASKNESIPSPKI